MIRITGADSGELVKDERTKRMKKIKRMDGREAGFIARQVVLAHNFAAEIRRRWFL
jgi:hypothetical protein